MRGASIRQRTRPCRSSIVRAGFGARDGVALAKSPTKRRAGDFTLGLKLESPCRCRCSHSPCCGLAASPPLTPASVPGAAVCIRTADAAAWAAASSDNDTRGTFGRTPTHVACFPGWRGRSAGHFCPRASRSAPSSGPAVQRLRRGVISMASCSRTGAGGRDVGLGGAEHDPPRSPVWRQF